MEKEEVKPIEPSLSKKIQIYLESYKECITHIYSLMGIPASRMGSEQGIDGNIHGSSSLRFP
jgi:hypothetical protein